MYKNVIIVILSISLLFCIFHFYRLRPYERQLHEREKRIQHAFEELDKHHFVQLDWFFFMSQPTVALEAGNPELALRWAELAMVYLREESATTFDARAEAYYCLGEYQKALEDYEAAFSRVRRTEVSSDGFEFIVTGLAKSHYQLGHKQEAAQHFVRVILEYDKGDLKDSQVLVNDIFVPLYLEKNYEKNKITREDVLLLLEVEKENSESKENFERAIKMLERAP